MTGSTRYTPWKNGVRIVNAAWPCNTAFLEAMRTSWISQYAEYIGQSHAQTLVAELLEAGELYPREDQLVPLAMVGANPVGVAVSRSMQGLALITMLEVLPAYRHQGVGRRLIDALEVPKGERLMAHVSIHRPEVLHFYEQQGFLRLRRTLVDHRGHELEFDVVVK